MELVHLDIARGVATITLDSPANRNALSKRLVTELVGALETAADDEGARAVLLTHTGHVFCSGADLSEASEGGGRGLPRGTADAGTRRMLDLFRAIVECPRPVVARVDGKVRAGGLGLMAACDVVIAADGVDFAFTEARLGLTPAIISLTVLPRMDARAAGRYLITGETFDAGEAARIGLINTAVPRPQLDDAVGRVLDGLRAGSPQGLAESKRLVAEPVRLALERRGEEMAALSARLFSSAEAKEGMKAFLERRPPRWARPDS